MSATAKPWVASLAGGPGKYHQVRGPDSDRTDEIVALCKNPDDAIAIAALPDVAKALAAFVDPAPFDTKDDRVIGGRHALKLMRNQK